VDGARTPETFSRLLDDLRECNPSRILTVFGCEGEINRNTRAFMGELAHYKADIVIISNGNPRRENPGDIVKDIVAGWPDDILLQHGWFLFPWYQDLGRLPIWYTDQALWAQASARRYIIEDRYLAIRGAIYMACKNDIIVIAGKGDKDYQEWFEKILFQKGHNNVLGGVAPDHFQMNQSEKLIRSWFDDRVEARNALSKLPQLCEVFPALERSLLPWVWPGLQRRHPLEEWDAESSIMTSNVQYLMR
jgi:hypothetical protein